MLFEKDLLNLIYLKMNQVVIKKEKMNYGLHSSKLVPRNESNKFNIFGLCPIY